MRNSFTTVAFHCFHRDGGHDVYLQRRFHSWVLAGGDVETAEGKVSFMILLCTCQSSYGCFEPMSSSHSSKICSYLRFQGRVHPRGHAIQDSCTSSWRDSSFDIWQFQPQLVKFLRLDSPRDFCSGGRCQGPWVIHLDTPATSAHFQRYSRKLLND